MFEDEIKTTNLVIVGIIAFVFFICIIIFVVSHITILVTISKFAYIIVGGIYYGYRVVLMVIYLIENESGISNIALVFFLLVLATIVPRVFAFYNLESLEAVCKKVDDNKRILEHEKFIERIGNKVDYGNSRWSNTLEVERISNFNPPNLDDKK